MGAVRYFLVAAGVAGIIGIYNLTGAVKTPQEIGSYLEGEKPSEQTIERVERIKEFGENSLFHDLASKLNITPSKDAREDGRK